MLFPCRFLGIPLLCLAWFFAYLSILNFPFSFLPKLYWYVLVRCTHVFSGKKYDEGLSLGKSKVDVLNRGHKLTLCCASNSKPNRTLPLIQASSPYKIELCLIVASPKILYVQSLTFWFWSIYVTWITYIIQKKTWFILARLNSRILLI